MTTINVSSKLDVLSERLRRVLDKMKIEQIRMARKLGVSISSLDSMLDEICLSKN